MENGKEKPGERNREGQEKRRRERLGEIWEEENFI